jgi:hypothetical protein
VSDEQERVDRYRAAIREQALDRFLSDVLAPDARDWIAGFSARAAVSVADDEMAAVRKERDVLYAAMMQFVPMSVLRDVMKAATCPAPEALA